MNCINHRRSGSYEFLLPGITPVKEEEMPDYYEMSVSSVDTMSPCSPPRIELNGHPPLPDSQVEIKFYTEDGRYKEEIVEEGLTAGDMCQLLALKNHVAIDINWALIELHPQRGIERNIEDHEEVLEVWRQMEIGSKLLFRKEFHKYEFFHSPQQFFPPERTEVMDSDRVITDSTSLRRSLALQSVLNEEGGCPKVFSELWAQQPNTQVWTKGYFLVENSALYYSQQMCSTDPTQLQVFTDLSSCDVYLALNPRRNFNAPTDFGICLRMSDGTLRCLACDSEKDRKTWWAAMRINKFGKQILENYKSARNRQQKESQKTSSFDAYREGRRGLVAMDFTGRCGRVVEDPKEARAIELAEAHSWRRRKTLPLNYKQRTTGSVGIEGGVHIAQPWYHRGLSREESSRLLQRHGTVDGVFLVRDSCSNPGSFVISFMYSGKVHHLPIRLVEDKHRNITCCSLDQGHTKFYDLLQLVEFYQLNAGSLPTRLTYYVVQPIHRSSALQRGQSLHGFYPSSC